MIRHIDPNKPRRDPYSFQRFPMMVYHQQTGTAKVVQSEAELENLGSDWGSSPVILKPVEPSVSTDGDSSLLPLIAELESRIEAIEEAISAPRRGPGRPRKGE